MKAFESKWGSWNPEHASQRGARSAKSPQYPPSGTFGTDPTRALPKNEPDPDDALAQGIAYKITKFLAEQEAVREVEAAWKTLSSIAKVLIPGADIKAASAMPTDDPLQILKWKSSWVALIDAAKIAAVDHAKRLVQANEAAARIGMPDLQNNYRSKI